MRRIWVFVILMLGCFEPEPQEETLCQSDADCLVGSWCGSDGLCTQDPLSGCGGSLDCTDQDSDGAFSGCDCPTDGSVMLDCNDTNSALHPMAVEVCDGIDNDCNDIPDDGIEPVPCPLNVGVCAEAGAVQICREGVLTACDYGEDHREVERHVDGTCQDGKDNNCDGHADHQDASCPGECIEGEMCSMGCLGDAVPQDACVCKIGFLSCAPDGSRRCLDEAGRPVIVPFQLFEIPQNGFDDNCNGQIDEEA